MRKIGIFFITILFLFTAAGCSKKQQDQKQVKYVFLFIGDGMGTNHAYITDLFLKQQGQEGLSFLKFPSVVLTTTNCADENKITDSGAGGTAIATGKKTQFHAIGEDRETGEKFKTIAEIARDNGWKVGIISSVGLNHATPASFYAHVPQRGMYNEIARQMWHSGFDFFGGGGLITRGKPDSLLPAFYDSLKAAGYTIALNKDDFQSALKTAKKVYLTDTASLDGTALYFMIDSLSRVSLADFTKAAIDFLYNPQGFFIMVEGGKIDWAAHANDVATAIYEVKDFDRAIRVALDFYQKHPDETMIIVTADHETGGLSLGYSKTGYDYNLEILTKQWRSKHFLVRYLQDVYPESYSQKLQKYVKASIDISDRKPAGLVSEVIDSLQHSAGIAWATNKHTGTMIPTYVLGPGADLYKGIIDNTFTFEVLLKVTGLNVKSGALK